MARQRISLVDPQTKKESDMKTRIKTGEVTPTEFSAMTPEDQATVNKALFEIASEKVQPTVSASTLEFILFAFMRIMNKKVNGQSLTTEDQAVETSLNNIMSYHQLADGLTAKADWLFDYMGYAEMKTVEFLQNREDHVNRKKNTTGTV